ncbi:MAG: DUF2293 domain-containing protein, partial [Calditrichaeota bacterium]|nr:DUF2293 domain-containing protein [Calditrichota bacterium]
EAKQYSPEAINLAVRAYIRHNETNYDELLIKGYERYQAREMVESRVSEILRKWESGS